jgi:hypothetical protein
MITNFGTDCQKGFAATNTLAYGEHLKVTKKMNCCEYGPWSLFTTLCFVTYKWPQ